MWIVIMSGKCVAASKKLKKAQNFVMHDILMNGKRVNKEETTYKDGAVEYCYMTDKGYYTIVWVDKL